LGRQIITAILTAANTPVESFIAKAA
jgi:hypothetical protein